MNKYRCNNCGHESETVKTFFSTYHNYVDKACPNCDSEDIVELTPEDLKEQKRLEKADERYQDKVDRRE